MAERGAPLRLMLFDRTCRGDGVLPGLSRAWSVGGALYGALRRLDDWYGAATWSEGLDWLNDRSKTQPIAEVQFWGHGEWGCAYIEEQKLTIDALAPGHELHERLRLLKTRLIPGGKARWWFRTCETFGTAAGHEFARAWTRFFDCTAAGHTHTINILQSGLHTLAPDQEPTWPVDEGVVPGQPRGKTSGLFSPSTITCFHNAIPRS
ncbi:MAG: hypothetical protein AB7O24_14410, partial [Kofleriaceae bacterium]